MVRNCCCVEASQNNCNEKHTEKECVKKCCESSYNAKNLGKQQNNSCKDACYVKYEKAKEEAYNIYNTCCEISCSSCDTEKCQKTLEDTLCKLKKERDSCLCSCDKKYKNNCDNIKKMEQECKQECTPYYLWQMYCCCGPDLCGPTGFTGSIGCTDLT